MKKNILAENMKRFGTKNLNDSDSIRNTKRVISEQSQQLKSIDSKPASLATRDGSFFDYLQSLGGFKTGRSTLGNRAGIFTGPDGKEWSVTLEYVWNQKGVDDPPKWIDTRGDGTVSDEFMSYFNKRNKI